MRGFDGDDDWVRVKSPNYSFQAALTERINAAATTNTMSSSSPPDESIQDRITRIVEDLRELKAFYKLETSASRYNRLRDFYASELSALRDQPFDSYAREEKVDYLLLQNFLTRSQRTLELEIERDDAFAPLTEPFAGDVKMWVEKRMRTDTLDPREVAASFHELVDKVARCKTEVVGAKESGKYSKATGLRAAKSMEQLREHLAEMVSFCKGYDPQFDWWVAEPYQRLDAALAELPAIFRQELVGIKPEDEDTIVGEPIGREGLLTELKAEMIPFSPEELIKIANEHYAWCKSKMEEASQELGFGSNWKDALDHVKNLFEPPGTQPVFIKSLVDQGIAYIKENDLVTVPQVAEEAIRLIMIPPSRQKLSPFFLGGDILQVSYPTSRMPHADKLMSMRGNNRHFSKATAFHEMIPGHHLQLFVAARVRPYRMLFDTPFYIEGWALYWEILFWNRNDFFTSPEDRVGTLFWRMHRCARIIFSLKFHLGDMTPQQCVDMLVDWVGHERSTAEGEVRRSFNGDYSPLYQAGYLLGAMQLWVLRSEAVDSGKMSEKEFHDRVLRANMMPIEMLRALILEQDLQKDFEPSWRFHGDV